MTDWAGEFPEHPSQKNMPSTGPVYAQILTLYKSLLPYIYIYIFPLYRKVFRASKPHKPGRCWIRNELWQKMASSSWYIYICIHIYGSASASPPNGDGCSVLLLIVPPPWPVVVGCLGCWWWVVCMYVRTYVRMYVSYVMLWYVL